MAKKRYSVMYDYNEVLATDSHEKAMTFYREDVLKRYAGHRKGGVIDNEKEGYNWIA